MFTLSGGDLPCVCPIPPQFEETESHRGEVAGPGPREQRPRGPGLWAGASAGLLPRRWGPAGSLPARVSFQFHFVSFDTWRPVPAPVQTAAANSPGLTGMSAARPPCPRRGRPTGTPPPQHTHRHLREGAGLQLPVGTDPASALAPWCRRTGAHGQRGPWPSGGRLLEVALGLGPRRRLGSKVGAGHRGGTVGAEVRREKSQCHWRSGVGAWDRQGRARWERAGARLGGGVSGAGSPPSCTLTSCVTSAPL